LQDTFGIFRAAQMTTIHSSTTDQKMLDLPHKDLRAPPEQRNQYDSVRPARRKLCTW